MNLYQGPRYRLKKDWEHAQKGWVFLFNEVTGLFQYFDSCRSMMVTCTAESVTNEEYFELIPEGESYFNTYHLPR